MTIPELPEWATGGSADIVEPSLGQKQLGYAVDDRPPAGWFNWWMNSVYTHMSKVTPLCNFFTVPNDGSYTGNFSSICYGDSRYVVVGASGEIQRSLGREAWSQKTAAGSYTGTFYSVHYGSWFVAIGSSGEIQTSSNGSSWSQRTAAGSYTGNFRAGCYGGGLYVIVGDSGEIQTSSDAITWTARTPDASFSGNFYSAHYGNGLFVIGGTTGEIQTSPDGITWTHRTAGSSSTATFYSGVYGSGPYMIAGSGGEVQTSSDGITWTRKHSGGSTIYAMAYSDATNTYAATGEAHYCSLDDGENWEELFPPNPVTNTYEGICYNGGFYYKCGNSGCIMYSMTISI